MQPATNSFMDNSVCHVERKVNGRVVTVKTHCVKRFKYTEPTKLDTDKNMIFVFVEAPFCA